jgi:PAS domain S-box-containing protein
MERVGSPALLLDYAQDKLAVVDEAGTYSYVNDAAERILGIAPDELVGTDAFEPVHPEDRPRVRAAFERVVDSEEFVTERETYRYRAGDGTWVSLESRLSSLTDEALDGYVVSSRDVTDRERARRERRETRERLAELAEATDDVLWMFSGDWEELLFVNPAYEDVYGGEVGRLREDPGSFLDCIVDEDVPVVEDAMECLSMGESVDLEYRVDPDSGGDRWVWVQGEPILEGGEVVRIVGFTRDVTDRRRRERQLAVLDNLLRHNVRTRTSEILGNAELVERDPTEEPGERAAVIRRAGEQLVESAEKQREIVSLLTRPGRPETVDLARAAADAVASVAPRHPDLAVETALPDSLPARALPEVECAVAELVENAAVHGGPGRTTVRVDGRADGDRAELVVADDGPAIPEFDRGVLAGDHETDSIYHSSGCGLWLVYWIVDLSGGDVDYRAPPDGGNEVAMAFDRVGG